MSRRYAVAAPIAVEQSLRESRKAAVEAMASVSNVHKGRGPGERGRRGSSMSGHLNTGSRRSGEFRQHSRTASMGSSRHASMVMSRDNSRIDWQSNASETGDIGVYRSNMHEFVCTVVMSRVFSTFILLVILVNSVFIAVEASRNVRINYQMQFFVADAVFITIYSVEFALKVFARPRGYWRSSYNRFDACILFVSYLSFLQTVIPSLAILGNITFLRILRALRALRALRGISFIHHLQVIVTALIKTFGSIVNILVLLFIVAYVLAIVGLYTFGGTKQYFGDLGTSFLTLFVYVTVDGWTDIQDALDRYRGSIAFSVLCIFVLNFVFTNLFIAVVVQNLEEATDEDRAIMAAKKQALFNMKKQWFLAKHQDDRAHFLQRQELEEGESNVEAAMQKLQSSLSHRDVFHMTDPTCSLAWLNSYILTLREHEETIYRSQQLHFEIAQTLAEFKERQFCTNALHLQ